MERKSWYSTSSHVEDVERERERESERARERARERERESETERERESARERERARESERGSLAPSGVEEVGASEGVSVRHTSPGIHQLQRVRDGNRRESFPVEFQG